MAASLINVACLAVDLFKSLQYLIECIVSSLTGVPCSTNDTATASAPPSVSAVGKMEASTIQHLGML